jgi:Protein of unknown function (DUF3306)
VKSPEDKPKLDDDSGFLGRWARRKQTAQRELTSVAPAVDKETSKLTAESDESLPLPSLDDILPGQDVSAFFQKHVPEALRAAALRKVWMTDPDIKDFIEMADYQLDYANPDSIPGWSSSIEGIDLKSMVEKIFNNSPKPEPEVPLTGQVQDLAIATDESADGEKAGAGSTLVQDENEALVEKTPAQLIQNGAPQNKQEESVVYEPLRKRHGGAIPT